MKKIIVSAVVALALMLSYASQKAYANAAIIGMALAGDDVAGTGVVGGSESKSEAPKKSEKKAMKKEEPKKEMKAEKKAEKAKPAKKAKKAKAAEKKAETAN